MTCDCKKFPGVPSAQPYDTQALDLVTPPQPRTEEVAPQRHSLQRVLLEYNPQGASGLTPALPNIFRIETPMTALAWGGNLPWNVVALIVPIEAKALLEASNATLFNISESLSMDSVLSGFRSCGLDQYWIMRPGESVEFGRELTGVAGIFAAPWSGLMPRTVIPFTVPPATGYGQDGTKTANCILNSYLQQNLQSAIAAGVAANGPLNPRVYGSSYDPVLPTTGPIFSPSFKVYFGKSAPVTVPWNNMPWVIPNVQITPPNSTVCIPPGARYVTLAFSTASLAAFPTTTSPYGYDSVFSCGYPTQLATGPWDVNVYWYGYDGLVHWHPLDQLTATARGQVSSTHDIEVFEIPRSAAGMVLYANAEVSAFAHMQCSYAFSGSMV